MSQQRLLGASRQIPKTVNPIWRDVKDAIRGVPNDYTQGELGRSIFLLAIPMVLEMFMQSIFSVCDAFFVGKLGAAAVATVGITESILVTVIAVGIGLAMGATATVARRVGEKDMAGATAAAGQALILGVVMSVICGGLGVAFAPTLLELMGAPNSVLEVGQGFAKHMLGGSGTILLLFLINAAFRGAGEPVWAMRALALANLLNVVLDPIFIFGWGPVPAMGLTGAAVATNLSRAIGVVYQLLVLTRGKSQLRLSWDAMRIRPVIMWRLIRISGVGVFQFLVAMTSYTGLMRVMTLFSAEATAGFTIAVRVILFVILPAWGMSNAAATLVGQNLGAGNPERAEQSAWKTAHYNMIFLSTVGILMFASAAFLIALFSTDTEVIRNGALCLRLVSVCYILTAYGMVLIQSFNGAGDTWTPTYIALGCHWVFKIPIAWFLAVPFGLGPTGVFIAIPLAEVIAALLGIILFRRGTWKRQSV